jgi:hypothetical protein
MGHLAEAIMTKSFINPRLSKHFHEKEKVTLICVRFQLYELTERTVYFTVVNRVI